MIVLHSIWDTSAPGKLHLWAEASHLARLSAKRSAKLATTQKTSMHPFALVRDDLVEAVGGVAGGLLMQDAETDTLTMRLPSTLKEPFPSPELALPTPLEQIQEAAFKSWYVVTAALKMGNALDFLLALPSRPPSGIAFGGDLRFWIEVARFSLELLSRQCFIPTIHEITHGSTVTCQASWEALLTPNDEARMQHLARQMPPICWSYVAPERRTAALLQDTVQHFLNQNMDAFVRGSLAATPLLPASKNGRSSPEAPQEQWVQALTSPEATFTAPAHTIKRFSADLQHWLNQLQPVDSEGAFRTCFRLDPPGEDEEQGTDWRVSFHLQANDDRSLLVPAESVWTERSSYLTFLKRKFENPQERLLADLGRASRLFPALEESLKTAHPQQLMLNTEQAYTFLRESAPLLEQSGFGVLVPPWWQKASARIGVKLHMQPKVGSASNTSMMGLDSIVDYNWQIAVGDDVFSVKEFERLVDLKQPLVKVRGQWVELRPEQIEAAIAFFKKKQRPKDISLGEALRIGLGEGTAEMGLPVLDIEADGWIQDALAHLSQDIPLVDIPVPTTFQGQLRPYQLKGVSWLVFLTQFGFGACLADSMGLGKTIELITLLLYEQEKHGRLPGPTLLICPMSIVGNWQKELQRFGPSLNVMIHYGPERLYEQAFANEVKKHDVVITTYALALRDKEHLRGVEWENVVIDEAQNIKNEEAKQTQAIKQLMAKHRIAMTGTPVENRLSELWSIMEFLNPGYLGTGTDFRTDFAIPIERYHNAEKSATLKRLIQPFVLRRLKTDKTIIQDLPEKMEMNVFCNLTREQATLYEAVVKEMMEKIERADPLQRRGLVLATLTKLKQVCNHPSQFLSDRSRLDRRSGKLARLDEMLEEVLAGDEKALIFTQYAEMGELLQQYLQERFGCEILFLHGGTPKKQRDMMVQRFQEERRGAPLFILSLKAGGVGLNLTAANHVFHFDRWWNPAVENQATDRAFRIGQTKNVQVHKFVCIGTLEERIDQMIEQKKELAESIVGSGESWLTEMSTDQLKSLFQLSQEAIGGE